MVLIGEVGFRSIDIIAILEQHRLKGTRLIALGDYRQLPTVCTRRRDQKVPSDLFEKSRLFHHSCAGNHFVLRRCRRSDQARFDTHM